MRLKWRSEMVSMKLEEAVSANGIVDSYTDKVDGPDGLYKDSPTRPNGNYLACQEGYKDPAPKNVVQYLRDY